MNLETQFYQKSPESITKDAKITNSGIKMPEDIFEAYLAKDEKVDMRKFEAVYGKEEVEKDLGRVEYVKCSKGFEKPTREGIVLENMFCDLVEKYGWFGEGAKLCR